MNTNNKLNNVLNRNYELLIPQFQFIYPFNLPNYGNINNRYNILLFVSIIKINNEFKVVLFMFKEFINDNSIELFSNEENNQMIDIIKNPNGFIENIDQIISNNFPKVPGFIINPLKEKLKLVLKNLFSTLNLQYGIYDINTSKKYLYLTTDLDIFVKYISGLRQKVKEDRGLTNFSLESNLKNNKLYVKRDVLNKIPSVVFKFAQILKDFISGKNVKDFINSFEKSNGKIIPKESNFNIITIEESKQILKSSLMSISTDFAISNSLPRNYLETPTLKINSIENINKSIKLLKSKITFLQKYGENVNRNKISKIQSNINNLEQKKLALSNFSNNESNNGVSSKRSSIISQSNNGSSLVYENENNEPNEIPTGTKLKPINQLIRNGIEKERIRKQEIIEGEKRLQKLIETLEESNEINENFHSARSSLSSNVNNSLETNSVTSYTTALTENRNANSNIISNENKIKSDDKFISELSKKQKEALNKLKKNVEEDGYLIYDQLVRLYNEYNKKFKILVEEEKKIFIGDRNNYMDLYKNFVRIMVLYLNEPDVRELYNNILLKRLELDTFYNLFTEIIIYSSYRDVANGSIISFDIDIKNIDNNNKIWISHIYMFGDYFDFKNNLEFIKGLTFDNNLKYNYSIPIRFDVKNKLFEIKYKEFTFNLYHIFNYVCKEILESNGNYCLYSDNLTYIIEKLKLTNQIKLNEFYLLYKIIRSIFDFNSNFVDGKYQEGMRSFKNGIRPNFYFMGSIVPYGKLNILEEFILNIRHNTNGLDYYMYNLIQMTKATMYKSENLNHLIIFEDLIRRDFPLFRDLINLINNSITQNMIKKFSKNYSNEFNNKLNERKEFIKLSERKSVLRGDLGLKYKKNISLSESNNSFKLKIENKLNKQKIFKNKKIQEYLILIEKLKVLKNKIGNYENKNLVLLKENGSFDLNKFIELLNKLYIKISNKSLSNMQQLEEKQMFGQYFSNERLAFNKYFIFYNLLQDNENMPNFIDILLNTSGLINLYEVSPSLNLGNYPTLYTFNFDLLSEEIQLILNRINLTNKNMIIFDRIKQNLESILEYERNVINSLYQVKLKNSPTKEQNINSLLSNNILLIFKNIYDLLKDKYTKLEICILFYMFGVQSLNQKSLFNSTKFNKINSNNNIIKIQGLINLLGINNNSLLNTKTFENKLNQRIKPLQNKLDELMTLREQIVNQFTQGEKKFNKIQQNISSYINKKYGIGLTNAQLEAKLRSQFIKDSKLKAFLEEKKRLKEVKKERNNFDDKILSLNQQIQEQERKIQRFKESSTYQNYLSNIRNSTSENKVKKYIKKKKSDKLRNMLNTIN